MILRSSEGAMPHSPQDKKRALTRLHRIKGQAEALERAIEAGTDCALLLQQIAALRGAVGGLMAEVLESHLVETVGRAASGADDGTAGASPEPSPAPSEEWAQVMRILRTYLK